MSISLPTFNHFITAAWFTFNGETRNSSMDFPALMTAFPRNVFCAYVHFYSRGGIHETFSL